MKNERPFFSIVTVTLNNLLGLKRTYESLLAQECRDFEWIVVDGASSDGTIEFLESAKLERFCWISEPDCGLYDAMNKGLARSQGYYLLFLNAGDMLADSRVLTAVKRQVEAQVALPGFIYGDAIEVDAAGNSILKPAFSHHMIWYGMFTHHQAMFYKRELIKDLKYDIRYKIAADFALTSEYLRKSPTALKVNIPICVFEGGGVSSSLSGRWQGMKEQFIVCRSIQRRPYFVCVGIFLMHFTKHLVKTILWPIYKRIRYSGRAH